MSDEDSSAFHVVDKRTGSRKSKQPETEAAPIESSETESEVESTEQPIEQTDDSADSSIDSDERALPDPSFLLSMATMQMEPDALIQALIPIFDGYAWRSMGFLADPKTGETGKNMAAAQLAIDTVQFLLSKIEAQLSDTDRRDTQRRLSDLRMNYIAKLRES